MKNKKKSKVVAKTVPLAKSLGALMKDEDGFVSKETILKVGLSTVAALGVAGIAADMASSQCPPPGGCISKHTNVTHSNNVTIPGASPECAAHTNITTHCSY